MSDGAGGGGGSRKEGPGKVPPGSKPAPPRGGAGGPRRESPMRMSEPTGHARPASAAGGTGLSPPPESPGKPGRIAATAASVSKPSVGDAPHGAPGFSAIGPSAGGAASSPAAGGWAAFAKSQRDQYGSQPASTHAAAGAGVSSTLSPMSAVTRAKPASAVEDPSAARTGHAASGAMTSHGASAPGGSARESIPAPTFVRPEGVHPEVRARGYPLGFESMEQFRDLTRPVAQANREGTVIVSGSSVTGFSAKKGTAFDKNPSKPKSDIDVGVVRRPTDPAWDHISDDRGFPVGAMRTVERQYGAGVQSALGRQSGIKFFDDRQIARDGRSYMVRPHTPERLRGGAGGASSGGVAASAAGGPVGASAPPARASHGGAPGSATPVGAAPAGATPAGSTSAGGKPSGAGHTSGPGSVGSGPRSGGGSAPSGGTKL